MSEGRLLQVNVSPGGVPKLPVEVARITRGGVEGDRQRDVTVHGGPHRAVSILGIEAIRRVAAEGHPIAPGTAGENLTVAGFDVSGLPIGTRLIIGDEAVVELSGPANPCRTIRHSFRDLRFGRLGISHHPVDSRMYARVVREGAVRPNDAIRIVPPTDDTAMRIRIASRLDAAERASGLAFWRAGVEAGLGIDILDDGEIAASAAPALPGPVFNTALGFADLPNLVDRALGFFASRPVNGWVMADEPPWPGATADTTLARWAAQSAVAELRVPDGVVVRELPRGEVGPWARVIVAASGMPEEVGRAWMAIEPHLAQAPHHHRFVAEIDGRPVAAGSVHTHRGTGWLRAGSVLPEFRGRGLQRALIASRADHARRVGCDLVGASTLEDGASARNVARLGFERVATRRAYPTEPAT